MVLDGRSAELTDDTYAMTWQIEDHLFKDLKSDERFNIQLHSVQFSGVDNLLSTSPTRSVEIYADIKLKNQSNTYNNNGFSLIGFSDANIDSTNGVVSSYVMDSRQPIYEINKFNEITIYCQHQLNKLIMANDETLTIGVNDSKFIFRITRIK